MVRAGETWLSGQDPVAAAVSEFGHTVARKLQRAGQKEDQLRGPIEVLLTRLGEQFGLDVLPYGEVALRTLRARPDYAVDIGETRIGYIEIKAPGKGVPPNWRPLPADQKQWEKLKSLPNLIYTDGSHWAHFRYGSPTGPVAPRVSCFSVVMAGRVDRLA